MQLADVYTRLLKDQLSDPAIKAEWDAKLASKPTGSGSEHNFVNMVRTVMSDDAKVHQQIYTEIAKANPELRKQWAVSKPIVMSEVAEDTMLLLQAVTPEELSRKYRKGLKLSLAEQHALRIAATDVMENRRVAADRHTQASAEWYAMPDGPAKDAFKADKLIPAQAAVDEAASRYGIVKDAAGSLTGSARELAMGRQDRLRSDIESQDVNRMREGLREFLRSRYPNKQELDGVINMLIEKRQQLRNGADWSTRGAVEWNEAYRKAFKFGNFDKFLQFYKAGLLGYPSRVANIASNTIFVHFMRGIEKDLAAAIDQGWSKLKGIEPEQFADEWKLKGMALRRGTREALGPWVQANKDALMLKPFDYSKRGLDVVDDLVKMPSAIGGKPGQFFSYMFKTMNAEDGFFKHQLKTDHYYRRVHRAIRKNVEGFEVRPGENHWAAVERIVGELGDNIRSAYDQGQPMEKRFLDIHETARKVAQDDTFQEEMSGWGKSLQQGMYTGLGKGLQVPIPFVKTPYNIAKQVLRRTPGIGWAIDAAKWEGMSRAERMDASARHLVSAAIGGSLMMAVGDGETVSGSGPLDPEANMLKQQTGWKPYAIKVGDEWISYQRLEPFSSLLGMLADIQEGRRQGDFDKVGTGAVRVLGSVSENITNKTFLSGLENLSQALSDPIRYAGSWVKRTEASLVPNTIGFIPYGHLAQAIDPVYREVGLNPVEVFKSKTPGLSQTLEPQYTPAGEVRMRPDVVGVRGLSPIQRSAVRHDPVAKAAGMLAEIGFPMRRVRGEMEYKGIRVPITPEEQRALVKAQNDAMQFIGKQLVNDPTFQRMPNNEDDADYVGQRTKKDVIARIVRRYRSPVMNTLNPQLRDRASKYLRRRGEQRQVASGA